MDTDTVIVAQLYQQVSDLNRLIETARRENIEVTLDVDYTRILDGSLPHTVLIELKVAKLLRPTAHV